MNNPCRYYLLLHRFHTVTDTKNNSKQPGSGNNQLYSEKFRISAWTGTHQKDVVSENCDKDLKHASGWVIHRMVNSTNVLSRWLMVTEEKSSLAEACSPALKMRSVL